VSALQVKLTGRQRGCYAFVKMNSLRFRAKVDPLQHAIADQEFPEECFFGLKTRGEVVRVPLFLLLARGGNLRGLVLATRQHKSYLDLNDYWSVEAVQALASYLLHGCVRVHFSTEVAVELFEMGQAYEIQRLREIGLEVVSAELGSTNIHQVMGRANQARLVPVLKLCLDWLHPQGRGEFNHRLGAVLAESGDARWEMQPALEGPNGLQS